MLKKFCVLAVVLFLFYSLESQRATAEEAGIKLNEVVVTATKTEKDPQDVTQTVTVITADEIKKSSATNAAEVVRTATGVTLNDQGPDGSLKTVSLRGSQYAQVLVLLDGRRLNSPRDGGFDLSVLPVPLEDIERIEIVRGPGSALYGADAVGGVVNIITKKPDKTRTVISGVAGSRGYDAVSLGNSGREGKFYYSLSTSRETSDGFRPNSDLDKKTVGSKIGYEITQDSSLEFAVNHIGKEIGAPGPDISPSPLARQLSRETLGGLSFVSRFSKETDVKITGYYNSDLLQFDDPNSTPTHSRHESATNGADAQINWLMNSWNAVTTGFEIKRDNMNSTSSGDHAASLGAVYVQDEVSIGEPLIVVLGGRQDSHSIYGDKFSPRASARYLIASSGTIIRASAGKSFRAPTFNDLYWPYSSSTWSGITYITQGNPNLRPETAKEYEAGIEQPVGKQGTLRVTGFRRKVKDMIDWAETQLDPTTYEYNPTNIGRARITGAEVESKFRFFDSLTWAVNYAYMNPVDELTGNKIYYTIPRDQIKTSLNVELGRKTNVYLEERVVKNYVEPGNPEWKYSVTDGKITRTVLATPGVKGDVVFGMNNIFDREYQTVRRYPMPPREIYAGMTVTF
jgi:outer membrane cobalamin receptor